MGGRDRWTRLGVGGLLVLLMAGSAAAAPRIKVVGEKEASGDVWKAYAREKQAAGIVPGSVRILSLVPQLLVLQQTYAQGLLETDHVLPARLKRMVGVVVSSALGSESVRVAQEQELLRLGWKPDQIQRLVQDAQSAGLSQREVTALKFARKVAQEPGQVSDQDFADLRWDGLSDPEILELTLVTGYFDALARTMQALGVERDEYPAPTQ
jgi:uncharacterized peroxidase-related enzyme